MILSGFAWSEGLAARIRARFSLVFAPRKCEAIFETVSFSTAVYLVIPVGAGAAPVGEFEETTVVRGVVPVCGAFVRVGDGGGGDDVAFPLLPTATISSRFSRARSRSAEFTPCCCDRELAALFAVSLL